MNETLKRSNSPIFWVLFGGGGMVAALFGPVLVTITGLLVPLGFMSGLMTYQRALAIAQPKPAGTAKPAAAPPSCRVDSASGSRSPVPS